MRTFSILRNISGNLGKNYIILAGLLVCSALLLAACSDQSPTKQAAKNNQSSANPNQTVAAPYPALSSPTPQYTPMPTPTAFQPIPLLPTNTPLPLPEIPTIVPGGNNAPIVPTTTFTTKPASKATAKTTPTVAATAIGTLAYLQGGNLWTINSDGTNRQQISTSGDLQDNKIFWSPTHDRLAYVAANNNLELLQLNGQKSLLFAPTPNQTLLNPVWSPSGRYLIFTIHANNATALTGGEIWLMDAIAPHFTPRKLANGFSPSWSPDSKALVYLTTVAPQNSSSSGTRQLTIYNEITTYTLATNQNLTLTASLNLPAYIGTDKAQHLPQAATFRTAWWSPNRKTIYFSDGQSFLGQIATTGGQLPKMLIGQPGAFAVTQMYWVGQAQIPLIQWDNAGETGSSHYSFVNGSGQITDLTGTALACPQTAPDTGLLAYADNQGTMVIEASGKVYGRFAGGGCPSWSSDGKYLATVKQGGDGSIVIVPANGVNSFTLQTVKGVDTVYWVKGTASIVQQGGAG